MKLENFIQEREEREELYKLFTGELSEKVQVEFNNNFFNIDITTKEISEKTVEEKEPEPVVDPIPEKPSSTKLAERFMFDSYSNTPNKQEVNNETIAAIEKIVSSMVPYGIQGSGGGLGIHAVIEEISNYTYNKAHIDNLSTTANISRITSADSPYNLSDEESIIFSNSLSGTLVVNLPVGVEGKHFRLTNTSNADVDVSVVPNGSEKLFGDNLPFSLKKAETIDIYFNSIDGWW